MTELDQPRIAADSAAMLAAGVEREEAKGRSQGRRCDRACAAEPPRLAAKLEAGA
jgi:hypothetical protein